MKIIIPCLLILFSLGLHAQIELFSSDFDGNTGAHVFTTDTDNTSGSENLQVTWRKVNSVDSISSLTAISTGNSGTTGGFAQTQAGNGTYANSNNVFISRNHNQDSDRSTSRRGYSLTFTLSETWDLSNLEVISGHTNNTGLSDQTYTSDLNIKLSGGSLTAPVGLSKTVDYGQSPAYLSLNFDLQGTQLEAGTYTLQVYQSNMVGGGAYATFNGITLTGDNGGAPLPTVTNFSSDKTYATAGSSVNFSWQSSGADTLTLSPAPGDVTALSTDGNGSTSVTIQSTGTYTLTATNTSGSATATINIQVGPPRPNIVFFLVDDMGPQDTSVPFNVDANGNPVSYNFNTFYKTPNMESLAADGMRFITAYAQSVCSPTRTGLMTGRNSTRHAVSNWVGSGGPGSGGSPLNWRSSGLDDTDLTLPQILSSSGYRTIHVGKAHFGSNATGRDPLNLGFDVNIGGANFGHPGSYTGNYGQGGGHAVPHLEAYHNTGTFLTKALTIEANKAIENANIEGRPFFLNMSFYAVHAPFTTNPDATGDYSAATNSNHAKYATMLEGMDLAIGQIRQKLVDLGIAENTLIVFVGDNGSDAPAIPDEGLPNGIYSDYPMRGKKGSKYEGGSRIPFITSWAKADENNPFQQQTPIPANSIEADIVTTWDIPVTFLSLAGIAKPSNFGEDGHDLLPYFRASPGSHRPQEIVIHYPHNHRSDYFSFIRKENLKLIYNYQNNSHQLFDLASDPTESNDLSAAQPELTTSLARKLAQHLDNTWGAPGALIPTIASTAPNGNVVSIPNNGADVDHDQALDTNEDPNLNGLVDPGETNPDDSDTDRDQTPDGVEIKLGTDPLDPKVSFRVKAHVDEITKELVLTWPSKPGTSYRIVSSTDLSTPIQDWDLVQDSIPATENSTSTSYQTSPTPGDTRRFYAAILL